MYKSSKNSNGRVVTHNFKEENKLNEILKKIILYRMGEYYRYSKGRSE
jgi:hypothetical protein